jgi:hypothetical protein
MRTLRVSTELSVEQIIQCNGYGDGCSDSIGNINVAYTYVKNGEGLVADNDYPYTSYNGVVGYCKVDDTKAVVGVSATGSFYYPSEDYLASYVQSTGTLSVGVEAANWNTYTGGVMTVCGGAFTYAQAVGVDASSNGYWKVRNHWGTDWGEKGFIRLAYGNNTCGIVYYANHVTVYKA